MFEKRDSMKVIHRTPKDLLEALKSSQEAYVAWQDITSLARNEFVCWVLSAKKPETRARRIRRTVEELLEGKRRPCCWPGCPHR